MTGRLDILHLPSQLESGNWRRVLRRWGQLLDDYSWVFERPRDQAYWHGERPLTGLLATAAWSARDGWALEEFGTPRGTGARRRAGRGDLLFGIGQHTFTVEAKMAWLTSNTAGAQAKVTRKLSVAKRQLRSLDRSYCSGRLVALCFVAPYLTRAAVRGGVVEDLMAGLPAQFAHDPYGVAVYRPSGRLPEYSGRFFPGVMLIAELL